MKLALAVATFLLLPFASAFEYLVWVGKDETTGRPGVGFTPSVVYPQGVGDVVVFRFENGTHSVVASSYDQPCTPSGGFDSGVITVPAATPVDSASSPTSTLRLNGTDPVWLFDQAGGQCHLGAIFAISPSQSQSLFQFKQNAANDTGISHSSSSQLPSGSRTASSSTPSGTHHTTSSAEKIVASSATALVAVIIPWIMYL